MGHSRDDLCVAGSRDRVIQYVDNLLRRSAFRQPRRVYEHRCSLYLRPNGPADRWQDRSTPVHLLHADICCYTPPAPRLAAAALCTGLCLDHRRTAAIAISHMEPKQLSNLDSSRSTPVCWNCGTYVCKRDGSVRDTYESDQSRSVLCPALASAPALQVGMLLGEAGAEYSAVMNPSTPRLHHFYMFYRHRGVPSLP